MAHQLIDKVLGHNAHKTTFVPFLTRFPGGDPVVKQFKQLGFEVYNYVPRPAPWHTFFQEMTVQSTFLTVSALAFDATPPS